MKPILVLAAQPTVDRTIIVPELKTGRTYRISDSVALPSGKALNVARALRLLKNDVVVIALLAGHSGAWIKEQLILKEIKVFEIRMPGENRMAYSIFDPVSMELTEFIEDSDGPFPASGMNQIIEQVNSLALDISAIVISGRGLKGFPISGYKRILDNPQIKNIPSFLDCYGPLLKKSIKSSPFLLKINHEEIRGLFDNNFISQEDFIAAGRALIRNGVKNVVITMGREGAYLVSGEGSWIVSGPEVRGAAIGSGDAMMAGIVHSISQGASVVDAVAFGVAAGAANVIIPGACLFSVSDIHTIKKEIQIVKLFV